MSLQTGDIAYLRYGSDNKWHWGFFSPIASTLVGFDADALTQFKAISSMASASDLSTRLQVEVCRAIKWCQVNRRPIRLILYKPRQKGYSTISVATLYVLSRCTGMNVVILGGQTSQTDNMWKMMRYYAAHDTFDWGNTFKPDALKVVASNDTIWERETARDQEAGRSGTYHAVLATELARWQATAQSDPVNEVQF